MFCRIPIWKCVLPPVGSLETGFGGEAERQRDRDTDREREPETGDGAGGRLNN